MKKFTLILIAIVLIAIFLWARNKTESKSGKYEQKLTKRCYGNKSLAERLINHELKRDKKLSRDNAAKDAIESLLRDNR